MHYHLSNDNLLHRRKLRYLGYSCPYVCMVGLLIIFGMVIGPNSIKDIGSNGEAYAVYGQGSNVSGSDTSGSVSLSLVNPEVTNLQTSATSGTVAYITKDFTVTSSNEYNIYVQTSTGNSNLTNGTSSIPSLTGSNIAPSSFSDNTWGYTVADNSPDPSTLTYSSVPTNSTNAIKTGSNASNKAFRLAFAAKFGDNATSGHYRTNIVLSVAANPGEVTTLYSVTYNGNGNTGGVIPATQMADSNNTSYAFGASTGGDLSKNGYVLAGWSEDANATTVQYNPGSTITLSATSPNKILYAVWKLPTLSNVNNMTDLTSSICESSDEEETKQLKDTRDGKTYWVTKLRDGNCWMTQNLDYDGYGTKITDPSKWDNTSSPQFYDSSNITNGNYYNWSAATNGTGSSVTTKGENASGSICPSGWRLPAYSGNGSWDNLATGLGSGATLANALYAAPYNITLSGYTYSNNLHSVGSQVFLWTSTAYSGSVAYAFSGNETNIITQRTNGIGKDFGFSIRCVLIAP